MDVEKVAKLARIELESSEKDKLQKDFEGILSLINKLNLIDLPKDGELLGKKGDLDENVLRNDDFCHPLGLYSKEIMEEAPLSENGYIKAKYVFE